MFHEDWSLNGQYDTVWDKKYEELKEFRCRVGHCNVPRGFNDNPSLGAWVHIQRTLYNYMKQ